MCVYCATVAKVSRDTILENWKWTEPNYGEEDNDKGALEFGSGYPSDPKCQEWMKANLRDGVFCFPDVVRFSWRPAKKAMNEGGVTVVWEGDEDADQTSQQKMREQLKSFLTDGPSEQKTTKKRSPYFEQRGFKRVKRLGSRAES